MSLMKPLLLSLLILSISGPPGAYAATAREGVEAAYRKAAEAASIKFLYGILSVRAPDFQAFGPNGKVVDPRTERATLERIINPAMAVKETTKILSFQQKDSSHAVCQVEDTMEITTVDPSKKMPILLVIQSSCSDEWVLTPRGWKQASNRVIRQKFDTRQPPLTSHPSNAQPLTATPTASPTAGKQ